MMEEIKVPDPARYDDETLRILLRLMERVARMPDGKDYATLRTLKEWLICFSPVSSGVSEEMRYYSHIDFAASGANILPPGRPMRSTKQRREDVGHVIYRVDSLLGLAGTQCEESQKKHLDDIRNFAHSFLADGRRPKLSGERRQEAAANAQLLAD